MGLFSVSDEELMGFYHRAWHECHMGFVDPRKFPYLDQALKLYVKEHGCSYDDALIFAKTGEKMGSLK